jgi:DNA-binding transcriptional MerR regulator
VNDIIWAFSAGHVCRLTGLSLGQLRYWDRTKFFCPQYASDNRHDPFSRVYSFRDLVGLETLATLRKRNKVPLQELRKVNSWLREQYETETPWASLTFAVEGRKVFVGAQQNQSFVEALSGQEVVLVRLKEVVRKLEERIGQLRNRPRQEIGAIERHRFVARNAHVLAGTRIPTVAVWQLHEAGYPPRAIIREFPTLKLRDVNAAIAFEQQRRAS